MWNWSMLFMNISPTSLTFHRSFPRFYFLLLNCTLQRYPPVLLHHCFCYLMNLFATMPIWCFHYDLVCSFIFYFCNINDEISCLESTYRDAIVQTSAQCILMICVYSGTHWDSLGAIFISHTHDDAPFCFKFLPFDWLFFLSPSNVFCQFYLV